VTKLIDKILSFNVVQPVSRKRINSIFYGLKIAYRGFQSARKRPQIWAKQRRSIVTFIATIVIVYIVVFILCFPIQIWLWILSFLFNLEDVVESLSPITVFSHILWFIPYVALFVLRYVQSPDVYFFAELEALDPKLSKELQEKERISFIESLKSWLRMCVRMLTLESAVFLLSLIPFFGRFVVPLAWFWSINKLGTSLATIVSFLFLIPGCETIGLQLLTLHVTSTAIASELLDPYLSRIEDRKAAYQIRKAHSELFLGFGFPFAALFTVPIIGLFCWGIAHGAAAMLFF